MTQNLALLAAATALMAKLEWRKANVYKDTDGTFSDDECKLHVDAITVVRAKPGDFSLGMFRHIARPSTLVTTPYAARKVGGSYQATGRVLTEFPNNAFSTRLVFEFDEPKGLLHIFRPDQIERLP